MKCPDNCTTCELNDSTTAGGPQVICNHCDRFYELDPTDTFCVP